MNCQAVDRALRSAQNGTEGQEAVQAIKCRHKVLNRDCGHYRGLGIGVTKKAVLLQRLSTVFLNRVRNKNTAQKV